MKYSTFPCADHSNEPLKAEIVCANGLHDFLSFIPLHKKKRSILHLCSTANLRKSIVFI